MRTYGTVFVCGFRDAVYLSACVFNDARIAQLLCIEIIISIKQAIKFNRNKCAVKCVLFCVGGRTLTKCLLVDVIGFSLGKTTS